MNKRWEIWLVSIFVATELSLLISVLTCSGDIIPPLSFSAIALAFVFSLLFISFKNYGFITQTALLFTVIADIFLILVEPRNQAVAMTSFSITQILHFVRILIETPCKKMRLANLITRIVLIVIVQVVTLAVLNGKADYVALISMFYFTNIILNAFFAFFNFKKNPLFAIGMLLFLFCDIFIGLNSAVGVYITVPENSILYKMAFPSFNWAWLFYIPSQTLIAISCVEEHTLKLNKNNP